MKRYNLKEAVEEKFQPPSLNSKAFIEVYGRYISSNEDSLEIVKYILSSTDLDTVSKIRKIIKEREIKLLNLLIRERLLKLSENDEINKMINETSFRCHSEFSKNDLIKAKYGELLITFHIGDSVIEIIHKGNIYFAEGTIKGPIFSNEIFEIIHQPPFVSQELLKYMFFLHQRLWLLGLNFDAQNISGINYEALKDH